ncbi:MAG: hypothetical protein ACQERF_03120 [Actinomycetota bacterium]
MGRHVAARSHRPSPRRPARRVVILAGISVATFACSPQGSDAPATAEAPATAAAAQEPGDLTPLEGFTVEGEWLDETTSDPGVRSWVEVDAELDGDLVSAPPDQPTDVRPPAPAPSTRPALPAPRPTSRSSNSPAAIPVHPMPATPTTALASPTTQPPTTSAPTTTAPTTTAPTTTAPTTPAPDSTRSTPAAPDPTAILTFADADIATALEEGLISAGIAVALSAKVDAALAALATDGPVTSACGAIGALLGLLAAQDGKEVPASVADQLIAAALAASAALAC